MKKFAKSRLGLGHIVKGSITLSEIDAQGAAGEYFPLPRWLAVKKALVNIQVSEDRCFANFFENSEAKHHFCAISRLSALIKGQGRRDGACYCFHCSARFFDKFARERKEKGNNKQKRIGIIKTHQELCAEHEKVCQVIMGEIFTPREKLPEPGKNILKFKKWDYLFKSPLRI